MSIHTVVSRADRGFSVIEMLVATAIMVSVTGGEGSSIHSRL